MHVATVFGSRLVRTTLLSALVMIGPVASGVAAPIPWANERLDYTVVDQDLRDLLTEIGARLNVPVQMTDGVKGRVHGRLPATRARAFLDNLAKVYGLTWYYDGSTLYVSAATESKSKLLTLGDISVDDLRTAIEELGVSDPRWPLRGDSDSHLVMISGPPQYLTEVETVLAALTQHARPHQAGIAVFRGRVAEGRS